jgi:hypothetical protein
MTASQFAILIERLDKFEEKFEKRLRRLEIWAGTAMGGLMLAGFAIANNLVQLG